MEEFITTLTEALTSTTFIVVTIVILIVAAAVITTQIIASRIRKSEDDVQKSKLRQTEVIVYAGFGIVFLLLISGIIVHVFNSGGRFLVNLSATIILAWLVMLICYYVWALYFYNINLGWSDDKWNRFRMQQEDAADETPAPNKNPHGEETLGLPPGTVRGTIALTILVGGLALTIGSFGMDSSVKPNQILVDNFDFYKQAFLMVIAFYFGVKSLDILTNKNKRSDTNTDSYPDTGTDKGQSQDQGQRVQDNFNKPEALG
jgi:hypothetical protein